MSDSFLDNLTAPGPRLPWLRQWLLEEVWSPERYEKSSKVDFLRQGETQVNRYEGLISSSATRVYDELISGPEPTKRFLNLLSVTDTAVVVFDGLSLREVPIILNLSKKSGFSVSKVDSSLAAIPSETIDFVERELPCGRLGPSQINGRKELRDKDISLIYHGNYAQALSGEYEGSSLLLWSSFPDLTYKDSGAKFESHFENIHLLFETTWMNTVQQIRGKRKLIITSDHGYIFLGTGMDFPRTPRLQKELNDYFGNDRCASLKDKPNPPQSDDIFVDRARQVAMVKGRVKTRSTGDAASKLYKHGGLSLMEMVTPWIELAREL